MTFAADGALGDLTRAYQFNQSLQRCGRAAPHCRDHQRLLAVARFGRLVGDAGVRVAVLQGTFGARFTMRGFSVKVIGKLRAEGVPIPEGRGSAAGVSAVDLFKHRIAQALRLHEAAAEAGMSLQCA